MKKIKLLLVTLLISLSFTSCVVLDVLAESNFVGDTLENFVENGGIEATIESISKATEEITPEMAYYVGRQVASSILGTYKVYDNPEATKYVNSVCSSLAINSDVPYLYKGYWVAILDTEDITAMATPGGHIFVSKGLIKCTDSEDALAAVIGHELSHIQLKHSIKAIKTNRTAQAVTSTVANLNKAAIDTAGDALGVDKKTVDQKQIDAFANFGSEITETLVNSGFSQVQEFNADKNALYLMNNAGYDPNAMIDMLEMIKKNTTESDKKGWQKTHPKPDDRISMVNKELGILSPEGYTDRSVRQERFNNFKKNIK